MSARTFLQDLLGALAESHQIARDILSNDDTRNMIVRDLGGTPGAAPAFPPDALKSVDAYRDAAEPGFESLIEAIQDFRSFHDALNEFAESLNLGGDAAVESGYRMLLDVLGWNIVRIRYPHLYHWMQVASFVEDFTSPFPGEFGGKIPFPTALDRLCSAAMELYGLWDRSHFNSEAGTERFTHSVFVPIMAGLKVLDVVKGNLPFDNVLYGWDLVPGVPGSAEPAAVDRVLARTLSFNTIGTNQDARDAGRTEEEIGGNLAMTVSMVPRAHGGPGIFLSLGGGVESTAQLHGRWHYSTEVQTAGIASVMIGKDSAVEPPGEDTELRAVVALEARPDELTGKAFDMYLGTGTGLSAELVRIEVTLIPPTAQIKLTLLGGVASVSPQAFDNFIARILPKDGLRLNFDLGFGLSTERGAFCEGAIRSAGTGGRAQPVPPPQPGVQPPPLPPLPPNEFPGKGLGLTIPIGKSLGPLTIHNLQLRAGFEEENGRRQYLLDAASSISTRLGPVTARLDRLGLRFGVSFPKEGEPANLGFCDLDVGGLKPNGVSLAIDARGIVSGGGFLYYDKAQELYAGVMQLTLRDRITVKAFGLVATRMPDGSKGYSMIVFVTAEDFRPIPIGMACTLRGIGGMIAINRTFNQDAMRERLKNKTLGTLLFPKDPIRNAPEIIRNLVTVFPAEEGGFLIGVLLKLGWFSPTLVTLDLAIMVEMGNRMRVIALGIISALLPSKDNDLVRLNMDAMGVLDMLKGTIEIDAVLRDSRLAQKFVMTGSMALRASLPGRRGGFVMAVGGLNPRFLPPMALPPLSRITIALASGNNPRLTCEAYFSITSNTIQFGARAQLYAAAFGFSIEGDVGFDVLVQLLPFHLIADFKASVQLKRGSRNLFKLSVSGTLEGPRPLRISGKASFEIFWCDFTIRFDKTLVSGGKPPLPPAIDVTTELQRALSAPDSWTTQLPANRQHGVSLRKVESSSVLILDPLGSLAVKQQVVPLNTSRDLDVFGGAPIAGARRFQLKAQIEGVNQPVNPLQDAFAPAQFFAMTDDEKLASPSFEDMDAGVVFGSDAVSIDDGASVFSPLDFETIVIDAEGRRTKEEEDVYPLIPDLFFHQVRFSAVGTATIRRLGAARFRNLAVQPAVTLRRGQFVVASSVTGAVASEARPVTFVEAQAVMAKLNRSAASAGAFQVLPVHERVGG